MAFGVAAYLILLFAASFSIKKRLPRVRLLGTASGWLRAHIWFAFLSAPMVLFHSGFGVGGLFEQVLMVLLLLVIGSGVYGWVMQTRMPKELTSQLPLEAIYDQIPHVCRSLRVEGDAIMNEHCAPLIPAATGGQRMTMQSSEAMIRDFYVTTIVPYLSPETPEKSRLSAQNSADALFEEVKALAPQDLRGPIAQLRGLCDQRRQLDEQRRLHRRLHSWLLIHIPLSMALIVLVAVHAVFSAVLY